MPKRQSIENPRWAKANRTEVVALRLDPKQRLLLELVARKSRVPAAKFVEQVLDAALAAAEWTSGGKTEKMSALMDEEVWSSIPALCFIQRAQVFPSLLTHEEELLWELIQQKGLADHPRQWSQLERQWEKLKGEAAERAQHERVYLIPGIPDEE